MMSRIVIVARCSIFRSGGGIFSVEPAPNAHDRGGSEGQGKSISGNQIGSSKLAGVHTTVPHGDPSKEGFYTILLYVPAHTSIPAHSHRDDHMAARRVVRELEFRLRGSVRREGSEEAAARKRLLRTAPAFPSAENTPIWGIRGGF